MQSGQVVEVDRVSVQAQAVFQIIVGQILAL